MFDNAGNKIMGLAKALFWIELISYEIISIAALFFGFEYNSAYYAAFGIVFMLAGPFLSWINSLLLYAFGELVNNSANNGKMKRVDTSTVSGKRDDLPNI